MCVGGVGGVSLFSCWCLKALSFCFQTSIFHQASNCKQLNRTNGTGCLSVGLVSITHVPLLQCQLVQQEWNRDYVSLGTFESQDGSELLFGVG